MIPITLLRPAASLISQSRPLGRYPGWRFAIEEDHPTFLVRLRRRLWQHFKERAVQLPIRVRWFEDLRLDLVLGNDQSRCLYVGGSFEPNEFAFLARFLQPGMRVVDAGANEGFYSVFIARQVGPDGQVLAIEPSPRERARLEHNIAINGLKNVSVISAGLGAQTGRAVLHIADAEHNGQNTLGGFVYQGVTNAGDLVIDLKPLDVVVENAAKRKVDLIKMDVEGAEMKVLLGAEQVLRESAPVILFELLDEALRAQASSANEVLEFLRNKEYRILKFDGNGILSPLQDVADASSNVVAVPEYRAAQVQALSAT
jgi:FkbM family methyltransferase